MSARNYPPAASPWKLIHLNGPPPGARLTRSARGCR